VGTPAAFAGWAEPDVSACDVDDDPAWGSGRFANDLDDPGPWLANDADTFSKIGGTKVSRFGFEGVNSHSGDFLSTL
jgi:hypothetical protein